MTITQKDPVLVVLQLSGGNDYLNRYTLLRPIVSRQPADGRHTRNEILTLDGPSGAASSMGLMKDLYTQGKVAIVHGVGYPNSPRSHSAPWTSGTPASRTPWAPKLAGSGNPRPGPSQGKHSHHGQLWSQPLPSAGLARRACRLRRQPSTQST